MDDYCLDPLVHQWLQNGGILIIILSLLARKLLQRETSPLQPFSYLEVELTKGSHNQHFVLFLYFLVFKIMNCTRGTSLALQWLRLCASNVGSMGSILVGELRSHMPCGQKFLKIKKKKKKKESYPYHSPQMTNKFCFVFQYHYELTNLTTLDVFPSIAVLPLLMLELSSDKLLKKESMNDARCTI